MVGPGFTLDDFRSLYEPRPPKWEPDPVEAIPIDAATLLPQAPAVGVSLGWPREGRNDPGTNTYLWVIDLEGIPYVLDVGLPQLGGCRPKHTNLTGGGMAFVGGEMWFEAVDKLYISGGSGRYEPGSEDQLEDSRRVFESFGYSVSSLGWNSIRGKPVRFLGEI
jgi:hypothetical protein